MLSVTSLSLKALLSKRVSGEILLAQLLWWVEREEQTVSYTKTSVLTWLWFSTAGASDTKRAKTQSTLCHRLKRINIYWTEIFIETDRMQYYSKINELKLKYLKMLQTKSKYIKQLCFLVNIKIITSQNIPFSSSHLPFAGCLAYFLATILFVFFRFFVAEILRMEHKCSSVRWLLCNFLLIFINTTSHNLCCVLTYCH